MKFYIAFQSGFIGSEDLKILSQSWVSCIMQWKYSEWVGKYQFSECEWNYYVYKDQWGIAIWMRNSLNKWDFCLACLWTGGAYYLFCFSR